MSCLVGVWSLLESDDDLSRRVDLTLQSNVCISHIYGFVGPGESLSRKMYQAIPRCSASSTLIRIFRWCNIRRCYSPMFVETASTEISKPKDSELQKRKDPTMLEEVDIKSLPRAERRHVEEFLKMSETRAVAMKKLSYKNLATFFVLFGLAMGVYTYTYSGLKQETFLEEIDKEVATELAEKTKED
ncbi:hypothetical protein LOAG_05860 [Loa loa]|uniref:Cytochrome c oxidase assembly factor 3 n=1 Tax=Loa loa TaxID=7209 RepID=A0A1I7VQX5_LOALO|nr:hypothetical protein LOAG_05860 [Loa loa]EFO22623.1 hypothetical protein LOAG_05860 [Loa loa]